MAINFPNSPVLNDIYSSGGTSWQWNGTTWNLFMGVSLVTSAQLSSSLSAYAPLASPAISNPTFTGNANFVSGTMYVSSADATVGFKTTTPSASSTITIGRVDAVNEGGQITINRAVDNLSSFHIDVYGSTPSTQLRFIDAASSSVRAAIDSSGHFVPGATNTYDLGTTSLRWRNIYTQDLHLSNGIGDYTVVEGEQDLFLVNNKNGKSYKFALIEVDASEVPPKSEV